MMNATSKSRALLAATALATVMAGGLWAAPAAAQLFKEPFTFTDRSPEAMAIYMRNRDDRNTTGGATATAGSNESPTLVCAGAGDTTATAAGNIMCVLAGSGANVLVGGEQDSQGNQDADANSNTTAADEIGEILYGEDGDQ